MSHSDLSLTRDERVTCVWSIAPVRTAAVLILVASCASPEVADREQRIVTALADDNYLWALRDPELTRLKLVKMQRGPYEWLRGTASLFWRDLMEPGAERSASAFGDPESSRVLVVGDPHPENAGTFRAADGTMLVDWNDFDSTGYGPFTGDLRRLGAGLVIAAEDDAIGAELVRRAATGYASQLAAIAAGQRAGATGMGEHPLLDDELDTAKTRGDRNYALDEVAPARNGVRALAFGDLEPVAADGVFEDRLMPVSPAVADWIDRAIAQWYPGVLDAASAVIKLRSRRVGAGVSSYAAYRYNVVLEGPTTEVTDDILLEVKETREGVIIRGVPRLAAAEWSSPAARSVATQRRLQARADADPLLGHALVGGLSLKLRNREAYQRGINREDLTALAGGNAAERAQLADLAEIYGGMLARAHGQALTENAVTGASVIAPLLAGRESAFADDIVRLAADDAALVHADHMLMKDRDLFDLILPEVHP